MCQQLSRGLAGLGRELAATVLLVHHSQGALGWPRFAGD